MEHESTIEEQSRKQKLETLLKAGINPYPSLSHRTQRNAYVLDHFDELEKAERPLILVGRIRLLRPHGKLTFAQIQDESAQIQILFQFDMLGEKQYDFVATLDVGDFIEVTGTPFITKKGEKTLKVLQFSILCKSLRPLPEKWHGLKDLETRYRRRYLDLIMNTEVRHSFVKRSLFIKNFRNYLENQGFMEVETPVLEHIPGGAEAEPFITHHNTLDIDLYLRISLELHLKRLIVGGYEKVFEIGKVFRNEGMSTQHLQEFTELEFYWAYADWEQLMKLVEDLYCTVIQQTFGSLKISYLGHELDFTPPWPKVNYVELFKQNTGIDLEQHTDAKSLLTAVVQHGLEIEHQEVGLGRLIDQIYKKNVRPQLIQPCFLINHPMEVSPLAKLDPAHPQRTQRFQVIIVGSEIGNGFSELNDPIDQRNRFEKQRQLRQAGDTEAYMFDEDFLQALEFGMPPTAGFGVGIDRFFMILSGAESIRDVVFFPTMKPETK